MFRTYTFYVAGAMLILGTLFSGWGCAKQKADIPTWIQIDSMDLVTIPGQGSSNHHFTDAWVYANSNLVGAFQLPASVPVLGEGNTNIIIYPGIQLNGLTALRTQYLKTVRYQQDHNLVPGQTININPSYMYDTAVTFKYMEDFEGSGTTMTKSNGAAGEFLGLQSPEAFEGTHCGLLSNGNGTDSTAVASVESVDWYTLPKGDVGGIFFEFNYKCNTSFTVSVLAKPDGGGNPQKIGIIGLNQTNVWKKVYVALSPTTNSFTAGNQFKPILGFARQPDIPVQQVYIDNIKILY